MKTRGRHSSVSKSVVVAGGFAERPNPPDDLNKRQIEIWREVVSGEDPSFFKTAVSRGLLADYCRRRATCEEITAVLQTTGEGWADDPQALVRYEKLQRMRDRENIATVVLATKLRLTNQSRYMPDSAARMAAKAVAQEDVPCAKRG